MIRSSRLLPLSLGLALLLGLGWFGYLRARGPALDRMLLAAIARGDMHKAAELLDQGANPNTRDRRSGSALAWAVHSKNAPMCKLLLERGAEATNDRTFTGDSLFSLAVTLGDPEIVKAFLDQGVDPRIARGQNNHPRRSAINPRIAMGDTYGPLRMAAQQGHVKVLQVLLDAGVPVDEESPSHYTALMEAAEHDQAAAAKYLISRGANLEHRQSLETPLIRACRLSKWKVARALIEAGADVNARDRNRWTALHWTARRQDAATMQLLAAKGAEVDARDGNGHTALMYAAIYGNPSVARWLLAHGAEPSLRDPRKHSALDIARQYNRPEVVRLLQAATGERELARRAD